jgi:steroid delta-isomerase-like uncharacterized protein
VAAASLAACSDREPATAALARRWIDALNTHDVDAIVALVAEHGTYSDPTLPRPVSDEGFRSFVATAAREWPDRVYTIRDVVADRDTAAVTWHLRQTYANTTAFPIDGAFLLHVNGGHITSVEAYFDATPYLRLLPTTRPQSAPAP